MSAVRTALRHAGHLGAVASSGFGATSTILLALDGDWATAGYALLATLWAVTNVVHRCPAPARAARGVHVLHFNGGPEDGGTGIVPASTDLDLHRAVVTIRGTDYTVTAIEQTCYTAEAKPVAAPTSRASR